MLYSGIGIMIATYVGARIFKKSRSYKTKKEIKKSTRVIYQKEQEISEDEKQANHYLKAGGISLALSLFTNRSPIIILSCCSLLGYSSTPNFIKVEESIRNKKIGNDILKALVTVVCVYEGYYFFAAIDSCFYIISSKLVAKTRDNSKKMLTKVWGQPPKKVWVLREDVEYEISLKAVCKGDIVITSTGEVIAIDGIVINGAAMVDQHALTGESAPDEKEPGSPVFAGTIVISGRIQVQVKNTGDETTAAKLEKMLEQTSDFKTQLRLKGDEWADGAAVPLLSIGGLALPFIGLSPATAIISCSPGNRLRLFTSLEALNHLNMAFQSGILVKDGRSLEELRKIDTILFDKTGTLTEEQPEVGDITIYYDGYSKSDILRYAAAAEQKVAHPISKAILAKAQEWQITIPKIDDSKYELGHGLKVYIDNEVILVGSSRFIEMQNIVIPSQLQDKMAKIHKKGYSAIIVSFEHQILGLIEIKSKIRAGVKDIVQNLKKYGIKNIAIVSGDHQQPTKHLADALGIKDYFFNVLPQDKAKIVEQLQKEGRKVCFVGDGINDTIAMKKANVSISLHGATAIATDVAQVVLMDGSLTHLPDLFAISEKLMSEQKKTLTVLASASSMVFFGAFLFNWGVVSSIVITNATIITELYRARRSIKQMKQ
ncbi:MAG: heavy metal translocating P-type ATPase [Thiomargarita sp.]|nr:heavy metal translocating P-type ATPase [Thiomargarita sp.]